MVTVDWQAAGDNPRVLIVNMITIVTDIAWTSVAGWYSMADGTAALVTKVHRDIIQVYLAAVCLIWTFQTFNLFSLAFTL